MACFRGVPSNASRVRSGRAPDPPFVAAAGSPAVASLLRPVDEEAWRLLRG